MKKRRNNIFTDTVSSSPGYNRFNRDHDVKMSFQFGRLCPILVEEILPGDRFSISHESMIRMAPMISPVMHRIDIKTHFFFVPNRIVFDQFDDFITGNDDVEWPYVNTDNLQKGSLADYMGVPPTSGLNNETTRINAIPFAAYNSIYNYWYRSQYVEDVEYYDQLEPGDNTAGLQSTMISKPRQKAWQHDYFTSALPFAQKGDSAVLPLGTFSDVPVFLDIQPPPVDNMKVRNPDGVLSPLANLSSDAAGNLAGGTIPKFIDPSGHYFASTSLLEAEAAEIRDVRRAFALQEFLELEARGGTRYSEQILAMFGVRTADSRLQNPEYIGGSSQRMTISEVLNMTQQNADSDPLGEMAGHGISVGNSRTINYRATEHGFIIGLIMCQPQTAYQDGIEKMWLRKDRLDYYWPQFAHIGEQAIENRELYFYHSDPTGTFGFTPRYAEYKFKNSRIAGDFREELNSWHLGIKYDADPSLTADFLRCRPSLRIFAVEDENYAFDHLFAHIFLNIRAVRPMPKFGVPKL